MLKPLFLMRDKTEECCKYALIELVYCIGMKRWVTEHEEGHIAFKGTGQLDE